MGLKVDHASAADIPALTKIQFKTYEAAGVAFGKDTPENREAVGNRLEACRGTVTGFHVLKCVHTDESIGQETLVGSCQWQLYEHERPESEWRQSHPMNTFEWLRDAKRTEILAGIRLVEESRRAVFGGKPYGFITNLVVDPAWQRKGVGALLTRWGMEQMDEKGIPGYVTASEAGYPLYKSLGWSDTTPASFRDGEDAPVLKFLRYDPVHK